MNCQINIDFNIDIKDYITQLCITLGSQTLPSCKSDILNKCINIVKQGIMKYKKSFQVSSMGSISISISIFSINIHKNEYRPVASLV